MPPRGPLSPSSLGCPCSKNSRITEGVIKGYEGPGMLTEGSSSPGFKLRVGGVVTASLRPRRIPLLKQRQRARLPGPQSDNSLLSSRSPN